MRALLPLLAATALLAGCPAATPTATLGTAPAPVAAATPAAATPAAAVPAPTEAPAAPLYEAPRITPAEAKKRLDAGEEIVLVDVRSRENYLLERLAGAVNAPWADVREGHDLPPKDKLLLLYCT